VEASLRAFAIRGELASLGDVAANPAQSLSALGVHLALRPQQEEAHDDGSEPPAPAREPTPVEEKQPAEPRSPARDTPPAELQGRASDAVAIASREPELPPAQIADATKNENIGFLTRLQRTDALLSLVVVLLSSILYSATAYNATWGSLVDWATAFGAGFTGQVVIKWALLPIYRSVRLRATPTPATPQPEAAA
jgi:hypothetical protein